METIGLRINIYRNSRRWTQRRLATEVGITQSALSDIENDKVSPKWDILIKIAERLELPVLNLLPLNVDKNQSTQSNTSDVIQNSNQEAHHLWEALLKAKEDLLKAKEETIEILKSGNKMAS